MDSFESNKIEAKKAQAMRNYHRQIKTFKKLELVTPLALLAWSSYSYVPVATKISADFLRHNVAVFGQPLYVFLAVNILIVVISVLSSQKPTKQDYYNDYVTITTTNNNNNNNPRRNFAADEHKPAPEVTISDKQIVCVDNAVNIPPVQQKTIGAAKPEAINSTGAVKDCEPACPVREYRRSRSERLDRVNRNRNRQGVMRRSETLIRRSSCEMDDLSSEEFRMTIENFIADKRKTLIKENAVDLLLHQKQMLALPHVSN